MVSGIGLIKTNQKVIEIKSQYVFEELSNIELSNFTFVFAKLENVTSTKYDFKPISGIYCIQNRINHKRYIGMSDNIFKRWQEFINYACQEDLTKFNKIYLDLNRYTLFNFEFFILEYTNNLLEREKYWINFYDSTKDYNTDIYITQKRKITIQDVKIIRTRYANKEQKHQVYSDYQNIVSKSGFDKIWQGITWKNIMNYVYTKENKDYQIHKKYNPKKKLTQKMIKDIKSKINNNVNKYLIYKDYKNMFNENYFIYNVYDRIKNGEY